MLENRADNINTNWKLSPPVTSDGDRSFQWQKVPFKFSFPVTLTRESNSSNLQTKTFRTIVMPVNSISHTNELLQFLPLNPLVHVVSKLQLYHCAMQCFILKSRLRFPQVNSMSANQYLGIHSPCCFNEHKGPLTTTSTSSADKLLNCFPSMCHPWRPKINM